MSGFQNPFVSDYFLMNNDPTVDLVSKENIKNECDESVFVENSSDSIPVNIISPRSLTEPFSNKLDDGFSDVGIRKADLVLDDDEDEESYSSKTLDFLSAGLLSDDIDIYSSNIHTVNNSDSCFDSSDDFSPRNEIEDQFDFFSSSSASSPVSI